MPLHLKVPLPKIAFNRKAHRSIVTSLSPLDSSDDDIPTKKKLSFEEYEEAQFKALTARSEARKRRRISNYGARKKRKEAEFLVKKERILGIISDNKEKENKANQQKRDDDAHLSALQLNQGKLLANAGRAALPLAAAKLRSPTNKRKEEWISSPAANRNRRLLPTSVNRQAKQDDDELKLTSPHESRKKPPPTPSSGSTRSSRKSNGTEHSMLSKVLRTPEEASFGEIIIKHGGKVGTYGSPCIGCGNDFCQDMKALSTVKDMALRYFAPRVHNLPMEIQLNGERRNWFYCAFKQHVGLSSIRLSPFCVVEFATRWFPPSKKDRLRREKRQEEAKNREEKHALQEEANGKHRGLLSEKFYADSLMKLHEGDPAVDVNKYKSPFGQRTSIEGL